MKETPIKNAVIVATVMHIAMKDCVVIVKNAQTVIAGNAYIKGIPPITTQIY